MFGEHNIDDKGAPVTSEHLRITRYYGMFAFFSGLRYPSPSWSNNIPPKWIKLWLLSFKIIDLTYIVHIFSCVMLLFLKGAEKIGVRTECVGSIGVLLHSTFKCWQVYKKRAIFNNIVKDLHDVSDELLQNPVKNYMFLELHKKRFSKMQHYCAGKMGFELSAAVFVYIEHLTVGFITNDPEKRITPLLGWYPLDYSSEFQFFIASTIQVVCFMTVFGRNLTVDTLIISIMVVINNQLLYLATLLGDVIDSGDTHSPKQRQRILGWWIRHHQYVLNIFEEFRKVASSLVCATYGYVSFIFFLALLRLTEDTEFDTKQQIVIVAINLGNLAHLYVISSLADDIASNSLRISLELCRGKLWLRELGDIKAVNLVGVRCTKPVQLVFADNRTLAVSSFLDIMTSLMSYFVTIYQLRN